MAWAPMARGGNRTKKWRLMKEPQGVAARVLLGTHYRRRRPIVKRIISTGGAMGYGKGEESLTQRRRVRRGRGKQKPAALNLKAAAQRSTPRPGQEDRAMGVRPRSQGRRPSHCFVCGRDQVRILRYAPFEAQGKQDWQAHAAGPARVTIRELQDGFEGDADAEGSVAGHSEAE